MRKTLLATAVLLALPGAAMAANCNTNNARNGSEITDTSGTCDTDSGMRGKTYTLPDGTIDGHSYNGFTWDGVGYGGFSGGGVRGAGTAAEVTNAEGTTAIFDFTNASESSITTGASSGILIDNKGQAVLENWGTTDTPYTVTSNGSGYVIYNNGSVSQMVIDNSNIAFSNASVAVFSDGQMLITNSTLSDDSSSGTLFQNTGNSVIVNSHLNSTGANGILNQSGNTAIVNSTLSHSGSGNAVVNEPGATLVVAATSGKTTAITSDKNTGIDNKGTAIVSGATITADKNTGIDNKGTAIVSGATITASAGTGVVAESDSTATTLNNTTINASTGVDAQSSNVTLSGSTVTGTTTGINVADGITDTAVTGGSVTSDTGNAIALGSGSAVTVTGGATVSSASGNAVYVNDGDGASANFTQSYINGNVAAGTGSVLNLGLTDSVWKGAVNDATSGGTGTVSATLTGKSVWDVTSDSSVSTLSNGGLVTFAGAPEEALQNQNGVSTLDAGNGTGITLTVGDYTGNDGYMVFGDGDQLDITGTATGNTNYAVTSIASQVATGNNPDAVKIVTGTGDSTWTQMPNSRTSYGGYEYQGYQYKDNVWLVDYKVPQCVKDGDCKGGSTTPPGGGGQDTPPPSTGGATRLISPETAAYSANLMAARTFMEGTTYHDRAGSQFADSDGAGNTHGMWLRTTGGRQSFSSGDSQLKTNTNLFTVELGGEIGKYAVGDGSLAWGVMGSYNHSNSDSHSNETGYNAQGMVDGYTGGLYATWLQTADENRGAYVDTWAKYGNFQNSVKGDDMSEVTYHTNGFAGSVEGGYTWKIHQGTTYNTYIQPQVQVIYDGLDMGDHSDGLGDTVSSTDSYNVVSRAGFRLYGEASSPVNRSQTFRPFFGMNYIHNTSNGGVTYNGDNEFSPQGVTNLGEAEVGVEGKVAKNVNVYAKVAQTMGGDGYNSTFGNIGVKASF